MRDHSAESSKAHSRQSSRWYNENNRGAGSQSLGRSGDVPDQRYGGVNLWRDLKVRTKSQNHWCIL